VPTKCSEAGQHCCIPPLAVRMNHDYYFKSSRIVLLYKCRQVMVTCRLHSEKSKSCMHSNHSTTAHEGMHRMNSSVHPACASNKLLAWHLSSPQNYPHGIMKHKESSKYHVVGGGRNADTCICPWLVSRPICHLGGFEGASTTVRTRP
jgi:hypothetical protein